MFYVQEPPLGVDAKSRERCFVEERVWARSGGSILDVSGSLVPKVPTEDPMIRCEGRET